MTNQVKILSRRLTELENQRDKLKSAILSIQEACPHKGEHGEDAMKYKHHDGHYEYYECELCNLEDKR